MLGKWEEISEDEILSANIVKYSNDDIVSFYTDYEEPRYTYYEYEIIFQAIVNVMQPVLKHRMKAADICGGAGKAAFILKKYAPSCELSLVDVSPKMLQIARNKANRQGMEDVRIVEADAFTFLAQEGEYDLIIFSSAIHHFKDPQRLLSAAAYRLSPEGMIVTIADPTTLIKTKRYKFFEFMVTNGEAKKRVLSGMINNVFFRSSDAVSYGDVAEYQALKGIDDKRLCHQLARNGLYPLVHLRYPAGEPYMLKIMPLIGLNWAFSLILRSNRHDNNIEMACDLKKQISRGLPFRLKIF